MTLSGQIIRFLFPGKYFVIFYPESDGNDPYDHEQIRGQEFVSQVKVCADNTYDNDDDE